MTAFSANRLSFHLILVYGLCIDVPGVDFARLS